MGIVENIAFTLLGALIGYLVSNWLAIGRDKRREFNDLINPIRRELLGINSNPCSNLTGSYGITLSLICEKLPFWKRKSFNNAVENYKKSKSSENINLNVDGMGGWSYKDTEWIVHAVNDLLKYLKPK